MDKKDLAAPENNGRHWANFHYSLQREPVYGNMSNINYTECVHPRLWDTPDFRYNEKMTN